MNRLRRVRHDQSGMSYVFIGMGMMAFLSATLLAIDVGMLMTSRSQAHRAGLQQLHRPDDGRTRGDRGAQRGAGEQGHGH
jgi:hypothetical protein